MCGALWLDDRPGPELLRGVTDALAPYGQPAMWSGTIGPWNAALCAIDPDAITPTVTPSGAVVHADATLFGRSDLRDRLSADPRATDVELIGLAYDRWGRDMFQHVNGDFSVAIVDPVRSGVLLARDHTGSRFLAMHERPGVVVFSSTTLSLTGFPGVGHDLDVERLAELAIAAYGTTRTFVRGVESIAPGCWRWIGPDERFDHQWWQAERIQVRDLGSVAAHATALREALEGAVARQLERVNRVGVLLSGGLDSASVAAVAAAQMAPRRVTSYTSVPPPGWSGSVPRGWIPDERFAVEALARQTPNLDLRFIHVRGASLFDHQRDFWELGAVPERNPLNMVWAHECIREAAADGAEVMLTGMTGNQAFSADGPLWLAELVQRFRVVTAAREAEAWKRATGKSLLSSFRGFVLWPLLPESWRQRRAVGARVDAVTDWLSATGIRTDRLAELDLARVLGEVADPQPGGWTRDFTRRFRVTGAQAELDAATRLRYGVEMRDPTSDRQLLEIAAQQPEWWRRTNGTTRAICRAAMADVLPPEIVERRTLGSQLPDWLDRMTDHRDEIGVELQAMRDHPASREVFDVDRLQGLFASWPDRSMMADKQTSYDYQMAMMRSVVLSRYARWFEERGRRVAAGGPAVVLGEPM
jgi:asparagine synthase (glutamine-hydrolysing)